jgi:opacity protein-like surface antigen
MKVKIIVLLIASLLPLNFASASDNNFYLKGALGMALFKFNKAENPMQGMLTGPTLLKRNLTGDLSLAAGYYLNEIFRTEIEMSIYGEGKLESKFTSNYSDNFSKVIKKHQISTIMLGGYADLFNLGTAKFFIGGKAGLANVKETIESKTVVSNVLISQINYKNKRSNNFAYGITTGVTIPLSDKAKTDIAFGYNDFGKSKSLVKSGTQYGKTAYKSLNLEAGFRFDL